MRKAGASYVTTSFRQSRTQLRHVTDVPPPPPSPQVTPGVTEGLTTSLAPAPRAGRKAKLKAKAMRGKS